MNFLDMPFYLTLGEQMVTRLLSRISLKAPVATRAAIASSFSVQSRLGEMT
jgi:hypothetical protein